MINATQQRRQKGLTLIELIVVLTVLVAISGLLLPQVDFLRRSSDKATGSAGIKGLAENVQLYRTLTGKYPDGWDSLMDESTTSELADSIATGSKLTPTTLTANEASGLSKIGVANIFNHEAAPYTNSYRSLPGFSGVSSVAVADGIDVAEVTNADIIGSIYPAGLPTGVRLIALGAGPNLTSLGKTMVAPPTYAGVDGLTQYNRFIAIFAVYESGKRAQLKGSLDSSGDFLDQEIAEFNENALE